MTVFTDTFDTVSPAGSDDPREADDKMREIKAASQERENVDHYWPLTGTEVSDTDTGEHRKLTLRTLSAAVVAALSATKAYLYRLVTDGELYFKDADDNTLQLSDKGNNLANDTYLTGTDEAETGSVDLIKAGRNEADDADVAIIPDAARMASDAAPGEDTGVANKKYVDDQVALEAGYGTRTFPTLVNDTPVEATTDGILTVWTNKSGGNAHFEIRSDSGSTPATIIGIVNTSPVASPINTLTVGIKEGDYYMVHINGDAPDSIGASWLPSGQ